MTSPHETVHWPTEIRYKSEQKALEIDFDDGACFHFPAEFLRVESPSAEVMGHGEGKPIISGRRHVGILEIEPVGNYAVRIRFDDMHDTGIYSWSYLRYLGDGQAEVWAQYLAALQEKFDKLQIERNGLAHLADAASDAQKKLARLEAKGKKGLSPEESTKSVSRYVRLYILTFYTFPKIILFHLKSQNLW